MRKLTVAAWRTVPTTYISPDDSEMKSRLRELFAARASAVIEIPGDHVPHWRRPDEIADIVARIARDVVAPSISLVDAMSRALPVGQPALGHPGQPGHANSSTFRQSSALANDEVGVMGDEASAAVVDHRRVLVALYDRALPEVFGYLKPRCGDAAVAEDLAAETFLAACDAIERSQLTEVTVGWLIGIARHKLVDHWRREARDERHLQAVADLAESTDDPWDAHVDAATIERTLAALSAVNRSALTLRYLDGLSVAEVAEFLDRTVPATDQVLARARSAFRHQYGEADR